MINPVKNWKTFSAGVGSIAGACGGIALAFLKHNPEMEVAAITGAVPAILAGLGLLFARDANVSSVDMGIEGVVLNSKGEHVITPAGPEASADIHERLACLVQQTQEAKEKRNV